MSPRGVLTMSGGTVPSTYGSVKKIKKHQADLRRESWERNRQSRSLWKQGASIATEVIDRDFPNMKALLNSKSSPRVFVELASIVGEKAKPLLSSKSSTGTEDFNVNLGFIQKVYKLLSDGS